MTRVRRQKLIYVATLVVLILVVLAIVAASGWSPVVVGILVLVLLIPGRVQGHYYRSFYRGLRLQSQQRWDDASASYARFLEDVERRPWIKRLICVTGNFYSLDIEGMAHNNVGGCHMERGELDEAERAFLRAAELDPESPFPHRNLALISQVRGGDAAVARHLETVTRLGYEGTTVDRLIQRSGEVLAAVEGNSLISPP